MDDTLCFRFEWVEGFQFLEKYGWFSFETHLDVEVTKSQVKKCRVRTDSIDIPPLELIRNIINNIKKCIFLYSIRNIKNAACIMQNVVAVVPFFKRFFILRQRWSGLCYLMLFFAI